MGQAKLTQMGQFYVAVYKRRPLPLLTVHDDPASIPYGPYEPRNIWPVRTDERCLSSRFGRDLTLHERYVPGFIGRDDGGSSWHYPASSGRLVMTIRPPTARFLSLARLPSALLPSTTMELIDKRTLVRGKDRVPLCPLRDPVAPRFLSCAGHRAVAGTRSARSRRGVRGGVCARSFRGLPPLSVPFSSHATICYARPRSLTRRHTERERGAFAGRPMPLLPPFPLFFAHYAR